MHLKTPIVNDIHVLDMKDGDVGIITNWSSSAYVGAIVQRFNSSLVNLGVSSDGNWTDLFVLLSKTCHPNCKVQILPPGTELVI